MKTILLAAAAALSLGVSSAYANENGRQSGGYVYPDYQLSTQNTPSAVAAQNGQATQTYVTQSGRGTWMFLPNQNQGNGS